MSLNEEIRARLINGFRAELADHLHSITDGLLAIEQQAGADDQPAVLEDIFRAAHNLKGAARAMGITPIEQLAHSLEDVLNALQKNVLTPSAALFTACYQVLDAIPLVPIPDEASLAAAPAEALHALAALNSFRPDASPAGYQTTHGVDLAANTEKVETADPAPISADRPTVDDDTIRISASRLDQLMADLGDLLVTKIKAEQRLDQMRQTLAVVSNW
ncbi:MAG TPA: Hpt domain-containing protein, partial [Anaerolineae bacterium]